MKNNYNFWVTLSISFLLVYFFFPGYLNYQDELILLIVFALCLILNLKNIWISQKATFEKDIVVESLLLKQRMLNGDFSERISGNEKIRNFLAENRWNDWKNSKRNSERKLNVNKKHYPLLIFRSWKKPNCEC